MYNTQVNMNIIEFAKQNKMKYKPLTLDDEKNMVGRKIKSTDYLKDNDYFYKVQSKIKGYHIAIHIEEYFVVNVNWKDNYTP